MKTKTALVAAALAAVMMATAAPVQAQLPNLAGPSASEGQKLTHARGYSLVIPKGWLAATDVEGTDFVVGAQDMSVYCETHSVPDVLDAPDDQIRVELATTDLGPDFYTKFMFSGAPELAYVSTGPQPEHPGGWPFQRAVATAKIDNQPITLYAYVTFKAKTLFLGYCLTPSDKLEATKGQMDGVINSIRINR